ncbi:2-polyprenyl-6-methoxyphenol hydroxylase-like FAD-dependent oxidoreductase [Azospirillum lipoferum]|uniref:NAD(P)-binding protein n=1 Tax=Azospirillum lipoferum TaxID=193 RepID=A0A5A9GFL5_AZOLI|nr:MULTISPECIES: FAD-dependent monooxygenase [Azospirillum]KAA0593196.1 NAD(P)-binding protein [Azospirillum lipoferum]MCP1613603.1 2-polyprenyl-6-methoxyphenol hydroxylase-like FAD-dependent oxidoreductase [Azospirillum lipoferum]MDW5532366.1 FAD-dependent monooxygenase [Azospirillum sp. NL1]
MSSVLIIGGGIGGMATAIRLRQLGHTVKLIDIDPHWRVYGAGITVTAPTFRAFRRLGLFDRIMEQGACVIGHELFHYSGAPIHRFDDPELEPGLPAAGGIMRPVLHRIMSSEVRRLGVDVALGVGAERIVNRPDRVDVTFTDGTMQSFDLAVAADGIYSKTRSMLFANAVTPTPNGQGSWRIVARRPEGFTRTQFYVGHENLVGINAVSRDEVYLFILNPDPDRRWVEPTEQPAMVRKLLADFGGAVAAIRDAVSMSCSIVYRPLEAALQPPPWHSGRVVLIGDAAHATTPHLASGAGSAVEDAMVLGEELERSGSDVPAALSAFTGRRYERCRIVVESSLAIGAHQLARGPAARLGELMGAASRALSADY